MGWAKAEINSHVDHWCKIAVSFLKEFHNFNLPKCTRKKESTSGISINLNKRCLLLMIFRQMYDAGMFPNCTLEQLSDHITEMFNMDAESGTICNSLSLYKLDRNKDFIYYADLFVERRKEELKIRSCDWQYP